MKCPKCHYVSFDGQQRCRNCGYDFSLSAPAPTTDPAADLPIRQAPSTGSGIADLTLTDDPPRPRTEDTGGRPRWDDVPRVRPEDAASRLRGEEMRLRSSDDVMRLRSGDTGRQRAAADADPLDLPLFERTGPASTPTPPPPDDRPLISATLPPRPPLSVRRTSADSARPRPRVTPQSPSSPPPSSPVVSARSGSSARPTPPPPAAQPREPRLELDFTDGAEEAAVLDDPNAPTAPSMRSLSARGADAADFAATSADVAAEDADSASLGSRALAGAIDVAFLLFVDIIVIHFTLRLTGLHTAEWRRLPIAPILAFLGLLHGGYLTMFTTASGQTMGKMIAKIKVVSISGGPVPFGSAVVRAFVWLLTVPVVIGLVPALISSDRRALHDRFAETRVIKAE